MDEQERQIEATLWLLEHGTERTHEQKMDVLRRLCRWVEATSNTQEGETNAQD